MPKTRNSRRLASKRLEVLLISRAGWPDVFNLAAPKPLARGIHLQLREKLPDAGNSVVSCFLLYWTSRPEYLQALLAPDAERVNLDGTLSSYVTDEQREHARLRLAKRTADVAEGVLACEYDAGL